MNVNQSRQEVYRRAGGRLLALDIYTPDPTRNCETGVLLLHGGGWAHGDKAMMAPYAATLAAHGFTPIAVQYRLLPDNPWPAQIDDVLAAIKWVQSHAAELGVRPDRIVLEGFSAGAHLSLMAGAKARDIAAIIAFFPPTRLSVEPANQGETNVSMLLGPDASAAAARDVSPIEQVHANFPPTFLLHGNADWMVAPSASVTMYEALIAAGVSAELHIVSGGHHEFCVVSDVATSVQDEVAAFIKRVVVDPEKYAEAEAKENPFAGGPEAFAERLAAMHG